MAQESKNTKPVYILYVPVTITVPYIKKLHHKNPHPHHYHNTSSPNTPLLYGTPKVITHVQMYLIILVFIKEQFLHLSSTIQPTRQDSKTQHKPDNTRIRCHFPEGVWGQLREKSGLAYKYGLTILVGVIDEGYKGRIKVILNNTWNE